MKVALIALAVLVVALGVSEIQAQNSITLTATLRDFTTLAKNPTWGHADFESATGSESDIVLFDLGANNLPQYNPAKEGNSVTTHGKVWFDRWWSDPATPGADWYSKKYTTSITLTKQNDGSYTFTNGNYFPCDGLPGNWGNEGKSCNDNQNHNFYFTWELHTTFGFTGNEKFTFSGDDDVWVFLNKKLAMDIGGVHGKTTKSLDLGDAATRTKLGITPGNNYAFDMFYAERHLCESNMGMTTTLAIDTCTSVDACGVCNGPTVTNLCKTLDCGNGTCTCATGKCTCINGYQSSGGPGTKCDHKCGNGIVEPGEDCDSAADPCCLNCKFNAGAACGAQGACAKGVCSAGGVCQTQNMATTTPCTSGTLTVCQQGFCDGKGQCGLNKPDSSSCSDDGKDCTDDVCVNGVCTHPNKPDSTTCSSVTGITACTKGVCSGGSCTLANQPTTTSCTLSPADAGKPCLQPFCNGKGGCGLPKPAATACPDDGKACTDDRCDASGNCAHTPKASGTTCAAADLSIPIPATALASASPSPSPRRRIAAQGHALISARATFATALANALIL